MVHAGLWHHVAQWRSQCLPVAKDKNEESLRNNKKNMMAILGKMRKVELLPTRDGKAGYASGNKPLLSEVA